MDCEKFKRRKRKQNPLPLKTNKQKQTNKQPNRTQVYKRKLNIELCDYKYSLMITQVHLHNHRLEEHLVK